MDIKAIYESTRDVEHRVHCSYRRMDSFYAHFHQSIEITFLLKGSLEFFIGTQKFDMEEGQITFTPEYFVHRGGKYSADNKAAVIIIPKKYYDDFAKATDNASYFFLGDKVKNKIIGQRIVELVDGIDNMSELLVRAYVNMILGLIAQNYEPEKLNTSHNDLMLEIIRYIDEHFEDNITLEEISSHFGYSKYYFSRLFNRTFDCNLSQYINSVRARAVNNYKGEENKTKVIIESGFNTPSSYYRIKKPKTP